MITTRKQKSSQNILPYFRKTPHSVAQGYISREAPKVKTQKGSYDYAPGAVSKLKLLEAKSSRSPPTSAVRGRCSNDAVRQTMQEKTNRRKHNEERRKKKRHPLLKLSALSPQIPRPDSLKTPKQSRTTNGGEKQIKQKAGGKPRAKQRQKKEILSRR